uniref:7TM_GPCR_Srx domain-containing protein n=1 Tax=Caenorhabditis tropicalis TaxID=1561998 RepID=A0A1I7SZH3_9PELO
MNVFGAETFDELIIIIISLFSFSGNMTVILLGTLDTKIPGYILSLLISTTTSIFHYAYSTEPNIVYTYLFFKSWLYLFHCLLYSNCKMARINPRVDTQPGQFFYNRRHDQYTEPVVDLLHRV